MKKSKHKLNLTKRINFLNTIIGKNLQVIDIIDIKKVNVTRIEYNLSVVNSKDVDKVKSNKYYMYDYNSKKLQEIN